MCNFKLGQAAHENVPFAARLQPYRGFDRARGHRHRSLGDRWNAGARDQQYQHGKAAQFGRDSGGQHGINDARQQGLLGGRIVNRCDGYGDVLRNILGHYLIERLVEWSRD